MTLAELSLEYRAHAHYLTYLLFFAIITFAVGQPPCAGVAQPVEQLICNQQVGGSNPSTIERKFYICDFLLSRPADKRIPAFPQGENRTLGGGGGHTRRPRFW